ncbi:MAG: hypothetical protein L3J01_05600 [Thiomicrorhabdus sp.]|nr:hypothetical protein [Thiomicrorhabdus sp.]
MSGGNCPTIIGLKLDRKSTLAVKTINSIISDMKATRAVISTGFIFNIFTTSGVPSTAFNISQADWEDFAKSSSHLASIQRSLIQIEAITQKIRHNGDSKQRIFWEAIENGCSI